MSFVRYGIYAIVIAVTVGTALYYVAEQDRVETYQSGAAADQFLFPADWKESPEILELANANFSTKTHQYELRSTAGRSLGADWPQFNGPRRDNHSAESGLLRHWPKAGPPLLWTALGLGDGYSGISVARGVAYTLTNKGGSECLLALDVGTGKKLWCTPFGPATQPSVGPGPRSTPTIDGTTAYGLGADGLLVAVEIDSGKILWRRNILNDFAAHPLTWGICESVLIDGDKLICTPGGTKGTLVALDKHTGETIWAALTPQKEPAGYASPLVAEIAGVRQYIQLTSAATIGIASADGKFLWRETSSANSTANCSSPLVSGDFIFSASGYGQGGALIRLSGNEGQLNASLGYHTKKMKCHHGDMVIHEGFVYGCDDPGVLTCLELETGKVKWQNRSVGKGSLTWADGCLYLRSEKGTVALIKASGEKYEELGRLEQPDRSPRDAWTHPVVAGDGRLFLRDQDALLCYDVKSRDSKSLASKQ